jgi:hypothetical protein
MVNMALSVSGGNQPPVTFIESLPASAPWSHLIPLSVALRHGERVMIRPRELPLFFSLDMPMSICWSQKISTHTYNHALTFFLQTLCH